MTIDDTQTPQAATSRRNQEDRLPALWLHDNTTLRPYTTDFEEIKDQQSGESLVATNRPEVTMQPPDWNHSLYKWVYAPMFSCKNPQGAFSKSARAAWKQWDAGCFLAFTNGWKNQQRKHCMTELARTSGVSVKSFLTDKRFESQRNVKDTEFAVAFRTIMPPAPRQVGQSALEWQKKVMEHFERCIRAATS